MTICDENGEIVMVMEGEPDIKKLHKIISEQDKIIDNIVQRVKDGEKLRAIISEFDLDDAQKWELEKEVIAHGI